MSSSLLEHPILRKQVMPMSVEMYHALGEMGLIQENVELLRGCILPKMSKSPRRTFVTQWLLNVILKLLPPGFWVRQEQPLTFADSQPEPDISVVRGRFEDYIAAHPRTAEIVVEVSISTMERDVEKIGIYAEAGVKEYWLVIPEEKRVEIWTQPAAGGYSTCVRPGAGESYMSAAIPQLEISWGEILA